MSRQRRRFTAEVKAQIVRRNLAGKEPVSKLAEEFGVQPSQIHGWVNLVLSQAEKAFERAATNGRSEQAALATKVEHLQAKIVHKNEVIAELMEANVQAKKELGEL
jgi:transposase-like protein